ncbi:MAG: type II secretion system protein N [Burkholderiaceae bacterium]
MTRWLPKLLTLLLACALAGAAAYWFMRIAGGPPAPDPRSLNRAVDAPVASFREPVNLFGSTQTQALTNVKLLGVIAGPDGKGRAILTVNDAPPRSYATGAQIAAGMKLKAVESRAVVVDSAGVESRIPLPPRVSVAANAITSPALPPRPAFGAQAATQAAPAVSQVAPAVQPVAPPPGQQAAAPAAAAAAAAAAASQQGVPMAPAAQVPPPPNPPGLSPNQPPKLRE